jgi:hypothetical protein
MLQFSIRKGICVSRGHVSWNWTTGYNLDAKLDHVWYCRNRLSPYRIFRVGHEKPVVWAAI